MNKRTTAIAIVSLMVILSSAVGATIFATNTVYANSIQIHNNSHINNHITQKSQCNVQNSPGQINCSNNSK